jgi:copper chaperone CopZ
MEQSVKNKMAILDLEGATCTSCIITIEHLGRRMDGVSDVYVDRGTNTIQVEYDGNEDSLTKLCELVDKIGYHAEIRATE